MSSDEPTQVGSAGPQKESSATPTVEPSELVEPIAARRKRAQKVLWWRVQTQATFQIVFLLLLVVDSVLGLALVFGAMSESRNAFDLGSRLFGDAEEAAWLGWTAYFAWVFFDRMNRARKKRRAARLARLLLKRGHPRWFFALSAA